MLGSTHTANQLAASLTLVLEALVVVAVLTVVVAGSQLSLVAPARSS